VLRIQRAFLGELVLVFALVGSITTAVVFAGIAIAIVSDSEGLATQFLADLLPGLLPVALSYSVPLSWLAAMCLVIGRMQAENEITALRASGVHLRALVVPAAVAGLLLGVLGMALDGYVVPQSQLHVKIGLKRQIPVFLNSLRGADRSIVLGLGRLSFGSYDPADGSFHDPELDLRNDNGILQTKVVARRVWIRPASSGPEEGTVEFFFDQAFIANPRGPQGSEVRFQERPPGMQLGYLQSVGASTLLNETFQLERILARPRDMTFPQLLYTVARGDVSHAESYVALEWLHRDLALGASGFSLGLFALALALALPASGRRVRDFILCFLPAVLLFFPLFFFGHSLARSGVPTWLAMWGSNLLLTFLGLGLLAAAFRR
jgi:lipopolysaccharide export LptBFGC system permease protein LptF